MIVAVPRNAIWAVWLVVCGLVATDLASAQGRAAVSSPGGFRISGFVAEFPLCGGAMRGVTVTLGPLGARTPTSSNPADPGEFAFDGVPAGDYTLTVSPPCNPFGCWPETPVSITDEDVFVRICPDPLPCIGDCDGDRAVTIEELLRCVNITLGTTIPNTCPACDGNGDGQFTIPELIAGVRNLLFGCPN